MNEEYSPIDALFDEENTDNILMQNEDGDTVEFRQIAIISYDDKIYALLQPLNADDGTALVFEIDELMDELYIVEDDATVDAVFEIYNEMLEEAE